MNSIETVAGVIQLAVAPVFLLAGIAGLLGVLSTRLARIIDRARVIERRVPQAKHDEQRALLRRETITEMTRLQAEFGAVRRGLGFALWSPDPEASSNPFSLSSYGHPGFTGTCLWIDPSRLLVVALFTNDVYGGREGRGIADLRVQIHRAIVESVDAR